MMILRLGIAQRSNRLVQPVFRAALLAVALLSLIGCAGGLQGTGTDSSAPRAGDSLVQHRPLSLAPGQASLRLQQQLAGRGFSRYDPHCLLRRDAPRSQHALELPVAEWQIIRVVHSREHIGRSASPLRLASIHFPLPGLWGGDGPVMEIRRLTLYLARDGIAADLRMRLECNQWVESWQGRDLTSEQISAALGSHFELRSETP